jgi:hypothetical protein
LTKIGENSRRAPEDLPLTTRKRNGAEEISCAQMAAEIAEPLGEV